MGTHTSSLRPSQTICHGVAELNVGEEDAPLHAAQTWCRLTVRMRPDKNGRGVFLRSYLCRHNLPSVISFHSYNNSLRKESV